MQDAPCWIPNSGGYVQMLRVCDLAHAERQQIAYTNPRHQLLWKVVSLVLVCAGRNTTTWQ
jgi:hypothetical protein